jgi:aspartate aminotransferase
MKHFREQVELLVQGLNSIPGFYALQPKATFYAFPNVAPVCNRLSITSHGLAMYLLEGADETIGVACLGGECFGEAGGGFLRFSCAEPIERLKVALNFIPQALGRADRVNRYLQSHPQYRQQQPYSEPSTHA